MTNAVPQELGLLAKLFLACAVVMIVVGILWHGVTIATFERIGYDLKERPGGPMSFRFVLQPLMALIAAILDGRRDARIGRGPFLWTILYRPAERVGRVREGLNSTARIILLGIAMDLIYQVIVLKTFYPVEALIIALLLAFVPYALARGLATRIAGRWYGRRYERRTGA
jgi:hypothetical protein